VALLSNLNHLSTKAVERQQQLLLEKIRESGNSSINKAGSAAPQSRAETIHDSRVEFRTAQGPVNTDLVEQPLDELLADAYEAIDQVVEELSNNIAGDILDEEVNGIFYDFGESPMDDTNGADGTQICNTCYIQHEDFCLPCGQGNITA
jgi:hypothetical protein